ncbi:MAG: hypothetical protein AN484_25145 [Aphanizomenon flos-aquae WA102]|uniref:Uncharacterized protein n=1 Tax=Aphanizomenon flos-aquae WA102 TaxID=1710896 RepID=A0A1B7WJE3_APHFL|nr:MAG: hypothetical protein AN484_25145 [Aphanizomenon flos-aquae WA102]
MGPDPVAVDEHPRQAASTRRPPWGWVHGSVGAPEKSSQRRQHLRQAVAGVLRAAAEQGRWRWVNWGTGETWAYADSADGVHCQLSDLVPARS